MSYLNDEYEFKRIISEFVPNKEEIRNRTSNIENLGKHFTEISCNLMRDVNKAIAGQTDLDSPTI